MQLIRNISLLIVGATIASGSMAAELGDEVKLVDITNQNVFRHSGYWLWQNPLPVGASELDIQDATFVLRAGLAEESNCYSFESKNYPKHFIRHTGSRLRIAENDNSDLFKDDATFCFGSDQTLNSFNYPNSKLTVNSNNEVWISGDYSHSTLLRLRENRESQACWNGVTGQFNHVSGNNALHLACQAQFGAGSAMTAAGAASYVCVTPGGATQSISYKPCSSSLSDFLLKAGWRTYPYLDDMSEGDKRNTLIVELYSRSADDIASLPQRSDEDLIARGETYLSLLNRVGYGEKTRIEQLSTDQQYQELNSDKADYLAQHLPVARVSQLPLAQRQALIHDNLPIWILHGSEDYYPKPFQQYLSADVKFGRAEGAYYNLRAWVDKRHHDKNGSQNSVRPSENKITPSIFVDRMGDRSDVNVSAMAPQAAPTYATYFETQSGEVWIRYFLFAGYNDTSATNPGSVIAGNHFADWVHVSVKLTNQGGQYLPAEYYFSAHAGGERFAANDGRLTFYNANLNSGSPSLTEVGFDAATQTGQHHVGVYLALGTHEAYAQAGNHSFLDGASTFWDITQFGSLVIPFADTLPNNSRYSYHPYPTWDMGSPMNNPYFQSHSMTPEQAQVHWLQKVPEVIFGSSDPNHQDSFMQIFTTKYKANESESSRRAIQNCGQDDGLFENNENFTAKNPIAKIFEWGGNFNN
ncbi:AbfB domain-containing protein [Hahella chejuensis]|uniref:AbfB domain-containing protein n=1 Tax=Hahella chejuensis TaxID=158327 RepID=UPI001930BF0D|nr:AbfB domain-containing protein [Hahella chejuensis]